MASETLLQAIAVTAELTGTELSKPAASFMAAELSKFAESVALRALDRCRRELRSRMSLADVLDRIDDGRPGPEEAWAMIPKDEYGTCVWTTEMAQAYGCVAHMLDEKVPARMAFKEAYIRLVAAARSQNTPVSWTPSFGWDASGREHVLREAVRLGRLTAAHVQALLPAPLSAEMKSLLTQ